MKLIVIEGACDGIGKSTQYKLLYDRLINDGNNVINHHFPSYNTDQGKCVENYLNGNYGGISDVSSYFVNSLFAIDRAVTWNTVLKDAKNSDDVVLLDRYTTSSIIYQSAMIENPVERKAFIDYIIDFEYNKLGIPKPDNVIFLQAPYDVVKQMRNKRTDNDGIINDLHERDDAYMRKVYNNAVAIANYLHWDIINCAENNRMKNPIDIHNEIYEKVKLRTK